MTNDGYNVREDLVFGKIGIFFEKLQGDGGKGGKGGEVPPAGD